MTSNIQLNWPLALPLINLLLNNIDGACSASASQLAFGQASHFPGILFKEYDFDFSTDYARDIMNFARSAKSVESMPHPLIKEQNIGLDSATHVYVRSGPKPKGFSPRYSGPHPVLRMGKSTADVSINDKSYVIARDRLKKAHLLPLLYNFAQIHMPHLRSISASESAPVDFNSTQAEIDEYYSHFSHDVSDGKSPPATLTPRQAVANKTAPQQCAENEISTDDDLPGPSKQETLAFSGSTSDVPSEKDPTSLPRISDVLPKGNRRSGRLVKTPIRFGDEYCWGN